MVVSTVCFFPFWIHLVSDLKSEGKAKAERRHGESAIYYSYTKKAKKKGATFEKKSGT